MKDKNIKNNIKDYQKYIDKYTNKSPLKARKAKNKDTKPPKEVGEDIDVFLVTVMIQTKHPDEVELDLKALMSSIEHECVHTETAPFRIGPFCGFGLRLVVLPQRLGAFLSDFGDYLDLSPELEVKEMDVISGQAHQIKQDK